ncbi:EamA family transporter RarD [candidate division KSB1 bacterium]|nr:EamA family transporter RarD [candidate division KSB1 bacterium]
MNRGVILTLSAYIFWGIHPIYWKQLDHVPSFEIVSHRMFWSMVFFLVIVSWSGQWRVLYKKIAGSDKKWLLVLPALLIGSNWLTYIWAVNAGFIIETSLGYFICPLVSVFLGVFILKERLRTVQWTAIGIAAAGVLLMTLFYGQFPWISLYLAGTWGTYGLLRKKSHLSSVEGLTLETTVLSVLALAYLVYLFSVHKFSFGADLTGSLLLMGTGVISGLPLLVFIHGARLIDLALVGILQYVYPTLIFIIGYFVYAEQLNEAKLMGFVFIWSALILYTVESTVVLRKGKQRAKNREQ